MHESHISKRLTPYYASVEEEYHLIRNSCGWMDLSHLSKLQITGGDRKDWLQGQITNDVQELTPGRSLRACILTPTGQILSEVALWELSDSTILLFPEEAHEKILDRLNRMIILEDVKINDLTSQYSLFSVQGPTSARVLEERISLPHSDASSVEFEGKNLIVLRSDRTGSGGWDLLFDHRDTEEVRKLLEDIPPIGEDAWNIARLESGFPLYGIDYDEKTLPAELGPHFLSSHVSFTKGCYIGQEVVMRIYARGHTNRTWMGLIAQIAFPPGSSVSHSEQKQIGKVTSSVVSPELGPIGAAYLRQPFAKPNELVIIHAPGGDVEATVQNMPLRKIQF
ncbi:MAG TPA: glycine cleavage T C-terminal barrel domain-containing protein [Fimbriimonadales bacterium]|nr:glycine cleavage T C-terminal barrel domain-containing protein [Fimbriimonadales bacterium]